MSAELATMSFRTESGMTEDQSWTVVDSAVLGLAVTRGGGGLLLAGEAAVHVGGEG